MSLDASAHALMLNSRIADFVSVMQGCARSPAQLDSSVELAPKNICYRRIGHIGREAATKAAIDRRDNTFCSYWGLIDEIPAGKTNRNRVYVKMGDTDTADAMHSLIADGPPTDIQRCPLLCSTEQRILARLAARLQCRTVPCVLNDSCAWHQ